MVSECLPTDGAPSDRRASQQPSYTIAVIHVERPFQRTIVKADATYKMGCFAPDNPQGESPLSAAIELKTNDKIVFIGDSITEAERHRRGYAPLGFG
jgi:hypothetical protein